jgi:hypothetical protein
MTARASRTWPHYVATDCYVRRCTAEPVDTTSAGYGLCAEHLAAEMRVRLAPGPRADERLYESAKTGLHYEALRSVLAPLGWVGYRRTRRGEFCMLAFDTPAHVCRASCWGGPWYTPGSPTPATDWLDVVDHYVVLRKADGGRRAPWALLSQTHGPRTHGERLELSEELAPFAPWDHIELITRAEQCRPRRYDITTKTYEETSA